jgi:hypothetical protein
MTAAKAIVEALLDENFDNAEKVMSAMQKGPIRAIGGIVYDADNQPVMNTTDLHNVIRALERTDILIRRTDSGGSPTWDLDRSNSPGQ